MDTKVKRADSDKINRRICPDCGSGLIKVCSIAGSSPSGVRAEKIKVECLNCQAAFIINPDDSEPRSKVRLPRGIFAHAVAKCVLDPLSGIDVPRYVLDFDGTFRSVLKPNPFTL